MAMKPRWYSWELLAMRHIHDCSGQRYSPRRIKANGQFEEQQDMGGLRSAYPRRAPASARTRKSPQYLMWKYTNPSATMNCRSDQSLIFHLPAIIVIPRGFPDARGATMSQFSRRLPNSVNRGTRRFSMNRFLRLALILCLTISLAFEPFDPTALSSYRDSVDPMTGLDANISRVISRTFGDPQEVW